MRRNLFSLILVTLIIVSLVPCISYGGLGGKSTDESSSSSTNTTISTPTSTPAPAPTPTPTPTSTSTPAPSYKVWYDKSVPIERNNDIETIIGKALYANAKNDVDSAIYVANQSGMDAYSAKYENVYKETVNVKYDENSNRYAAVIEMRWNWKYQNGERIWNSWYYTYTGSYIDEEVIIDTRVQVEDDKNALENVSKFWENNWPAEETEIASTKNKK